MASQKDKDGKSGESRDTKDLWGDKKTEHFDKGGNKTGESA
jgi:hypothetical protein